MLKRRVTLETWVCPKTQIIGPWLTKKLFVLNQSGPSHKSVEHLQVKVGYLTRRELEYRKARHPIWVKRYTTQERTERTFVSRPGNGIRQTQRYSFMDS